jgi:hypothetical protein
MEGVVDPMHPVKRDEFGADDLGKEFDLRLDVLGANRQMMHSICQTHDVRLLRIARKLLAPVLQTTCTTERNRFLIDLIAMKGICGADDVKTNYKCINTLFLFNLSISC